MSCAPDGTGSLTHPTLRTYTWATFELPKSVYHHTTSGSARKHRRNPIVLAREWQQKLAIGEVPTKAELAYQLGVSKAHVTHVLSLLQLSLELQNAVVALGDPMKGKRCGIHTLRNLLNVTHEEQVRWARQL